MNRRVSIGVMALSLAGTLMAQELPKAETILDKYLEVTGGKAAYAKLRTLVQRATVEMVGMGIKGTIVLYRAEPDRSYRELTLEGQVAQRGGYDGKVAWLLSALEGAFVLEGEDRELALQAARFNFELNWRDVYPRAETTAIETAEGKECYRIVLTPAKGVPLTMYYDRQSNLLVKMTMPASKGTRGVSLETIVSDYRKDGEILAPHTILQKHGDRPAFLMHIDSIDYNVDIPREKFELPNEVRALVKE